MNKGMTNYNKNKASRLNGSIFFLYKEELHLMLESYMVYE